MVLPGREGIGNMSETASKNNGKEEMPQNIASYISDARRAAEPLFGEENIKAAFLAGPLDKHRITPASDLHIVLLAKELNGVVYRHVLPRFSPVGRRLEIGCFSIDDYRRMLSEGLAGLRNIYELEKMRAPLPLFDKDGILDEFREKFEKIRVKHMLVGQSLASAKPLLAAAREALEGNDDNRLEYSMTLSRAQSATILGTLLLASHRLPAMKMQWIYGRARGLVDDSLLLEYEKAQGVEDCDCEMAKKVLDDTVEMTCWILDSLGIDTGLITQKGAALEKK